MENKDIKISYVNQRPDGIVAPCGQDFCDLVVCHLPSGIYVTIPYDAKMPNGKYHDYAKLKLAKKILEQIEVEND